MKGTTFWIIIIIFVAIGSASYAINIIRIDLNDNDCFNELGETYCLEKGINFSHSSSSYHNQGYRFWCTEDLERTRENSRKFNRTMYNFLDEEIERCRETSDKRRKTQ